MEIRKAVIHDVKQVHRLINGYAEKQLMLSRSLNEIYENLRDFWVAEEEGDLHGCCALHISWEDLAEIKSIAIREDRKGTGIGRSLVEACIAEAAQIEIRKLFALTYQPGFFEKLGFVRIEKEKLPHKIWSECINCYKFPDCDETALEYVIR